MDPNEIVGQPREYDVWLAPDWSDWSEDTKGGRDWTRVSVRETLYRNGRKITQVLDEKRQPITNRTLRETIDKPQEERWTRDSKAAQTQTDQAERRVVSVTYQGAGKSRQKVTKYETGPDKVEDDPETEKPRKVVSVTYQGTGKQRRKVTTYDNGETQTEDAPTEARATGVSYDTDGTKVTKYDDGTETREQLSPAQRRAEEDARKKTRVTEPVQGSDGKQYTKVTETDPTTGVKRTFYTNDKGEEVPLPGKSPGFVAEPAGAPRPHLTLGMVTEDLSTYSEFLADKVRKGELTPEQADKLLERRRSLATSAIQEQTALVNTQRGIFSDEVSQRNADVQETASRRQDARMATTSLDKYLTLIPHLGKGGGALLANAISTQNDLAYANANRWGGLDEHPRVTLPPFLQRMRNAGASATGDPSQASQQTPASAGPAVGAVANGVTATTRAAADPSGANVQAANDATMAGSRAAFEAAGVPAPAAAPVTPPAASTGMGDTVTLRHKGTGMVSQIPRSQLPYMTNRDEFDELDPTQIDAPGGAPTVGMSRTSMPAPWQDRARYGQEYSPDSILAKLVDDPWMDTEAALDAHKDLYGRRPKQQMA